MSRNGSGVYSLPAGNPVVTGTTISSSWANTTLSDIATALTGSVAADGQTAMTGNLQMGNNKVTGLAVATSSGDALSYGQAATISSLTVTGAFAANGGATLGDASGDALTINSSAVSIPNGLAFSGGNVSIANNLAFTSTGNRITGDFSNATLANRVAFQTSTTNGTTSIGAIAAGTGTYSGFSAYNSSDSANASVATIASATSEVQLVSTKTGTGSYLPMTFYTAAGERMRIDTSGNVGIGTTSPGGKLNVSGTSVFGANNNLYALQIGYNNTRAVVGQTYYIGATDSATPALVFSDAGAVERARLDTSGNLLVGLTSAPAFNDTKLWLSGNSGTTNWSVGPRAAAPATFYVVGQAGSAGVYLPTTAATSWSSASDERIKTSLIPFENAVEKVCSLRSGTGRYLTDDESVSRSFLIAQDVQAVLPEAVNVQNDEQGTLGLSYTDVIPLLVAAIKEQQAIITDLKARIEALETK